MFDAMESLDSIFDLLQENEKAKVLSGVKKQLNSSSPKARNKAREFLEKYKHTG